MKPFRRPDLGIFCLAFCLAGTPLTQSMTAGEPWNDRLSKFAESGQCAWVPRETAKCPASISAQDFRESVRKVLNAAAIPVISDSEFDNTKSPKVLVGIRCCPIDRFLRADGGPFGIPFFGIAAEQYNELSQLYIQLLEPESGSARIQILSRSAQHPAGDPALESLDDPANTLTVAHTVITRIIIAISNREGIQ
jgi:hypothetical protein